MVYKIYRNSKKEEWLLNIFPCLEHARIQICSLFLVRQNKEKYFFQNYGCIKEGKSEKICKAVK